MRVSSRRGGVLCDGRGTKTSRRDGGATTLNTKTKTDENEKESMQLSDDDDDDGDGDEDEENEVEQYRNFCEKHAQASSQLCLIDENVGKTRVSNRTCSQRRHSEIF